MDTQFAVTQPSTQLTPVQARRHLWGWLPFGALLLLAALWGQPAPAHAQTVITVDADAPGPAHDGLTWTTAYTTVQNALDLANANDGTDYEIWVAEGTYYPDAGGAHVDNEVGESFRLNYNNVQLYGGFAATETLRTQRDWTAHPTILSGDIDQDDTLANNAWHVLYLDGWSNEAITTATVIDGFTVTGGNAAEVESLDGYGGGLYCDGSDGGECSPTLTNLIFSRNLARQDGGGMYNDGSYDGDSSPTLTNVLFRDNAVQSAGGGMANDGSEDGDSSPTLTDVVFQGNLADVGGGMANNGYEGESSPTLTNVTFRGNLAVTGGGMFNEGVYGGSSPALINVLFHGNMADAGGGMANIGAEGESSPALINVTFSGNTAVEYGGGIYSTAATGVSNSTLENCVLWGNTATISGTQLYNEDGAIATIRYSTVQGGYAGAGNLDADPRFVAPITASSAPTTTGDYRLQAGSPAIDAGNTLSVTVATDLDGKPRIVDGEVDMGAYEKQPTPLLTLAKQVTPAANVPYQGVVTYTLMLSNTGNLTGTAILTDALPTQVLFGGWLANPGATQTAGQITWNGAIPPAVTLTYVFTATHTGAANITVTNTAHFSGVLQSGQAAAGFTTVKANPTMALASAPNPSVFGQSVTFTATVTVNPPGAGTPTGVVTFTTASGALGTGALAGGVATLTTASLPGGSHVVTATYGGDANFAGSHNLLTQTVLHRVQVAADPVTGGVVTGDGFYGHGVTAVVTATANSGYTFTHWAENGQPVATTAIYAFTATGNRTLTAIFTPLPQPLARNDAAGVLEGEAVTISVLANDRDPAGGGLTVSAVTQPRHGAASINPGSATVHYAADAGVGGVDSFTYTLQDANGMTSTALVAVVVTVLTETDVAPQVEVVDPALRHTLAFTSSQAIVAAEAPAGVYTGVLALPQIFFLSYTSIVTPTAHTLTPPDGFHFGNFQFDLAVFVDDIPQPGFHFAQPVVLTIRYDPALLNGLLPATLTLYGWDGAGWSTEGVTILHHDLATATLTVLPARSGEFAFFAAAPTNLDPAPEPSAQAALLYLPAVMR
jgi:predicted outer membrane repeat protein